MTKLTWHNIHPHFRLNGTFYTVENLPEIAHTLLKEGREFERPLGNFLLDWVSPQPHLEVFTSGSTGIPKKIVVQKTAMINSAVATGTYFNLHPGHAALLCLPCSGIAGKMMLVRALMLGLQLEYVKPSSTPLKHTQTFYDFAAMVPLQVQNSLEQLTQIKTLIVGGAPVSRSLKTDLYGVSTQVFETYGMTETLSHIAVKPLGQQMPGVFETLPGVKIAVDDRGCLVIQAPHLVKDKITTNDLVALIGDTRFRWLGRYDTIINSGGIKLVPEQVEEKLSSLIHSRFFVAGLPDEILGQQLALFIENEQISPTQLLQDIKALPTIGLYEIPKKIFCVSAFAETRTGKIHRQKTLRQLNRS